MNDLKSYGLSTLDFIKMALAEDAGDGDHTSLSTIEEDMTGIANVKAKEDGIAAGLEIAKLILTCVDSKLNVQKYVKDGHAIVTGDVLMIIEGKVRSMLKAERLLLNFIQRMSGIATLTRKFVDAVKETEVKILDTRKTTPNFRHFEKLAVKAGGDVNHRYGLYDMILIKDNHVDAAGGISHALRKAAIYLERTGKNLIIEFFTIIINRDRSVKITGTDVNNVINIIDEEFAWMNNVPILVEAKSLL